MGGDLFSIFDYGWGASFSFLSVPLWFGGILVPLFVASCLIFWLMPSMIESGLVSFGKTFGLKMPEEVKWMGGPVHVFLCLFITLIVFNVSSVLPYHYPLSAHFFVVGSYALSLWLGTVFMNFSPNFLLWPVMMVQEGGYLFPNVMVMFSEIISFLARPVTLTCRLVMNIIIGKIIGSLIGGICIGVFLPFFWYQSWLLPGQSKGLFMFLISKIALLLWYPIFLFRHICILFIGSFMVMVELGVAFLQSCIFCGLLVYYVYEVPFKVKSSST